MAAPNSRHTDPARARNSEAGFSLAELMVASALFLIISSIVTQALLQMSNAQRTIWNRTEMHSGVRSATELLQQEVGQAGRVAVPSAITIPGGAALGANQATLNSVNGLYVGELIVVDGGANQETAVISAITTATKVITISKVVDNDGNQTGTVFANAHAAGAAVNVYGGFQTGVIPPLAAPVNFANGSTPSILKMYGDVNGDGSMVYVEYTCDTANGYLYRNSMPFDQTTAKVAAGPSQILLTNITTNPGGTACFQYQMDAANQFVLDVAVTLTVNTQQIDPITRQVQQETKALLNVSPRNVMDAWELHGHSYGSRVQPTPTTVTALLP
jgi:prepilin-type N-terminal cleavage/methylation domain-containing protein